MSTKSTNNNEIIDAFNALFSNIPEKDIIENEAKILMFRFLEIIDEKRIKLGWSKKQLAERIGTSASYITQLMRGDKLVNLLTLAKMQKATGVKFEIKEKISYNEQTKNFNPPIPDGKGIWVYKPFTPDYKSKSNIPKVKPTEEAA